LIEARVEWITAKEKKSAYVTFASDPGAKEQKLRILGEKDSEPEADAQQEPPAKP
jgi:hypothetical protein